MSDMWNAVAGAWEANAEFVDGHLESATRTLLDVARIAEGAHVLELGAGPGGAGLAAAERAGATGHVVLSDVAPEMAAASARRARELPQVSTAVFDQDAIAVGDERFDAVISRHALMFAEDPVAVVRGSAAVLRPGGRVAVMTWGPREANPWLGLVLDAVGEQFGVPFPPPQVRGPFSLDDPARLAGVLDAAGLTDVEAQAVPVPMTVDSLQAWWERVPRLAGPLALALAGMDEEVRDAIGRRALAAGEAACHHADGQLFFDGAVLIAGGTRPAHQML